MLTYQGSHFSMKYRHLNFLMQLFPVQPNEQEVEKRIHLCCSESRLLTTAKRKGRRRKGLSKKKDRVVCTYLINIIRIIFLDKIGCGSAKQNKNPSAFIFLYSRFGLSLLRQDWHYCGSAISHRSNSKKRTSPSQTILR